MSSPQRQQRRAGLRRVPVACERCRTRKNKCDHALPVCSLCRRAGTECIVVDRLTHRQHPRDYVDILERENAELKTRIDHLEHDVAAISVDSAASRLFADENANDVRQLPSALLAAPKAIIRHGGTYVGDSGGLFFACAMQELYPQAGGYHTSCSPCTLTPKASARNGALLLRLIPYLTDKALPSLQVHRLVNAFFRSRWPTLPFLHRPSFYDHCLSPFLSLRERTAPDSIFLLLVVCAIGAVDEARQDPTIAGLGSHLFAIALSIHTEALEWTTGLATVQISLLVACFAITQPCDVDAWEAAGHAVRAAITLGLHRRPNDRQTSVSLLDVEMRKRVFWSAYALDRSVSLALGRPFAIADADLDIDLPSCMTDQDLITIAIPSTDVGDRGSSQDMTSFIHIIKLRQLRSSIKERLYPPKNTSAPHEIRASQTAIHRELDDWIAQAPRMSQVEVPVCQTTEWIQIAYSQSLLLLYRPSPACPTASLSALQICAENAVNFVISYSSLYAKNKISYSWISLHSLFMASITMLYMLWVSPILRSSSRPALVSSNIKISLGLFEVMQETWPLAARCRDIVSKLGDATLRLFKRAGDQPVVQSTKSVSADSVPFLDRPAIAQVERNHLSVPEVSAFGESAESTSFGHLQDDLEHRLDMHGSIEELPFSSTSGGFDLFDANLPYMMDAFNAPEYWPTTGV